MIMERGADVAAGNNLEETPLHLSASAAISRLLRDCGANVLAKDYCSRAAASVVRDRGAWYE